MLKRLLEPLIERVLARLFGPSAPDPDLCEGWAVGDLAECLFEGPWRNAYGLPVVGPVSGQILEVVAVRLSMERRDGERVALLSFARFAPAKFEAACFRHPRNPESGLGPAAVSFLDARRRHPLPAPLESEMS